MNPIWAGISPYWAWIKLGALVAVCAGCYVYGGSNAKARAERTYAVAAAKAEKSAREAEQRHQHEMTAIAEKAEKDKRDAEEANRRLVADLRAGNVRLQDRWSGCIAQAGRSAAELDAAARDREESAARIVQAARAADDQIRGLQEVIRSDRK